MDSNDIVDIIVLMSKGFLLFVQICLSRRMIVLGQGGVPLQVVHVGRRMHYALLLVEVDGEWGARDFVLLILWGDRHHKQVHPRRWTRHSTSTTRIIRCRCIRSSLDFIRVMNIRRGMSITRGYDAQFHEGYQPEQPPQPQYVDALEHHHVEPPQ